MDIVLKPQTEVIAISNRKFLAICNDVNSYQMAIIFTQNGWSEETMLLNFVRKKSIRNSLCVDGYNSELMLLFLYMYFDLVIFFHNGLDFFFPPLLCSNYGRDERTRQRRRELFFKIKYFFFLNFLLNFFNRILSIFHLRYSVFAFLCVCVCACGKEIN